MRAQNITIYLKNFTQSFLNLKSNNNKFLLRIMTELIFN
jgi:hypothetical protein